MSQPKISDEELADYLLAMFRMSMGRGDVIKTTADVPKLFEVARIQVMEDITMLEKVLGAGKPDA